MSKSNYLKTGLLVGALILFGAGCAKQSSTPTPESMPSDQQSKTNIPGQDVAPDAGSCIPVEVSPGKTTCVMSGPQDPPTGQLNKVGQDEIRDDNSPEPDHEEIGDPDPARD